MILFVSFRGCGLHGGSGDISLLILQVPIGSRGADASPRAVPNTVPVSWQYENATQTFVTHVEQVGVVSYNMGVAYTDTPPR